MHDHDGIDANSINWFNVTSPDTDHDEEAYLLDIDRMVNEGLGGGKVTIKNGYIGDVPPEELVMDREEEFSNSEEFGIVDDHQKEK